MHTDARVEADVDAGRLVVEMASAEPDQCDGEVTNLTLRGPPGGSRLGAIPRST